MESGEASDPVVEVAPDSYLDEVMDEAPLLFASSGAVLTIQDPHLHPIGKAIGVFLLFVCLFGFLNGLDYATVDEGLVRPDEFVYRLAQTAPPHSAVFSGHVYDDDGQAMENVTVYLSWLNRTTDLWESSENSTISDGSFRFERLNPGLIRVDLIYERDEHRDVFSNRVLLSPPALIEPIGFTNLDFNFPNDLTFETNGCTDANETDCEIRTIDMTPLQMDHPIMDPSAAAIYVMIGFGFMGLSLMAGGFTLWALKTGSVLILRTGAVLAIFTMGHYYTACIFGLLAFVLTFSIPKRYIPLELNES